jgi:Na+-driven multidrug efflux pump
MLIAFWLIGRHRVVIGFPDRWTFRPDFELLRRVAAVGVPAGIQAVTLNIGGAILIYFINQLKSEAAALSAYVVCYTQLFAVVTWTSFGLRAACATVMGQNIGAGKTARGERAVYIGAGIGFLWAAFFGVIYWTFPSALLSIFGMADVDAVRPIATQLLRFLAFSGVFVSMALAFTGGLQGAGDTKKPMFIAIITQIVILLGACFVALQLERLSTTVIWSFILVSHISRLGLTYAVFFAGKWRDIKVELGDTPAAVAPVIDPAPDEVASEG